MTSPSTLSTRPIRLVQRPGWLFVLALAVALAAFLLSVGLGPDRLPFPPESDYSDAVTSHWPNALFLRQSVLDDHAWPLWRPLIMSGQPFAANPLNKVWYPPQWLALVLEPALHLNVLIGLHLALAGAGAWTWARATGLTPWAAALAGGGYAFAPRIMAAVGAGHLDLVYAAAWVPWLLWAVYRAVQAEPARFAAWWLAGFASLCFLADVRLSLYALLTALAYGLWRGWQQYDLRKWRVARRPLNVVIVAGLLAVGMTAFQWVPLLLMAGDLSRTDISLADAAVDSLSPGGWLSLLFGDPGGGWETFVYVGISTLALAVAALLWRPRALGFWGAVILVVALYAMGDHSPLWLLLNEVLPPLRWWRVPARAWFVAALVLPYLAGWGAQLLAERSPDPRRALRLGLAGLLGAGLACGFFSTVALTSALELVAAVGTFALPVIALVMLLALLGKLPTRWVMPLCALVVVLDVAWIDRLAVEGRGKDAWLDPYRPLAEYLAGEAGAVRVYSPSYSLPQQVAAHWNIAQFDGVDPFQLADYVAVAEVATGVPVEGYSVTIPAFVTSDEQDIHTANQDADLDPALLGQWLVTHLVSAFELDADGLVFERAFTLPEGPVYVYRNTLAPEVRLAWDGPNRVTVYAQGASDAALYPVAPGRWQDTQGLLRVPDAVDGPTPIGSFTYSLLEVWLSAVIALLSGGMALVVWWWTNRE